MLNLNFAGTLGRDAEFKSTQSGQEFCSFSVAVNVGFGDQKQTVWVDVTKWGKGAEGLSRILRKGSKVAGCGQAAMREANGKTYLQCRADNVTILSTPEVGGANRDRQHRDRLGSGPRVEPLDDDPFDAPF